VTNRFAPRESSWETENVISISADAQASVVDKHGSTTSRTKELGPTKVETTTPFRVKGLRVIVYTPTPEFSLKGGKV
jgi:hypothetical protein